MRAFDEDGFYEDLERRGLTGEDPVPYAYEAGFREGLLAAARMASARASVGTREGLTGSNDAYLILASDLRRKAK